ncbi:endonuclease/exonuclease/phosphatase family protein [Parapedobacter koreensis]|uniref:Metal-dependent hydrolase, endonuclease/exonuclease/phosphatase family n=1 Tax=Parapedobacter koreensis TaxID=332977 RepID=A0A1H7LP45_9SPHI|nr:endonuclease/exonuclease/phosphatase family protein [Parapedobacter koreensis]SEL00734.1 Metal-dependent hydrolase, endonuclease/exonuclease/phosphatase family [Parapedobacter koreensis]
MIVINPIIKNRQWPIRALLFVGLTAAIAYTFANRTMWPNIAASASEDITTGIVLADNSRGSLSLMTYNIAGLPEFISSASTPRAESIAQIGRTIASYDIVHVQEDFNYNPQLYAGVSNHSFRTKHNGVVPFGDGLNILSKYPIIENRRISWRNCSGTDCLTPKGFMFTRVQLAKHVFVDFYNLHATAEKNPRAAYARQKNLQQLSQFIQEQSKGNALVVMGDFNAHYTYMDDDMQRFIQETSLADAWIELIKNGIMPQKTLQHQSLPNLSIDEQTESLDKILYRGNQRISLMPTAYHVETGKFVDPEGNELSDHLPISVVFNWRFGG